MRARRGAKEGARAGLARGGRDLQRDAPAHATKRKTHAPQHTLERARREAHEEEKGCVEGKCRPGGCGRSFIAHTRATYAPQHTFEGRQEGGAGDVRTTTHARGETGGGVGWRRGKSRKRRTCI